jgi:hypothetical protein
MRPCSYLAGKCGWLGSGRSTVHRARRAVAMMTRRWRIPALRRSDLTHCHQPAACVSVPRLQAPMHRHRSISKTQALSDSASAAARQIDYWYARRVSTTLSGDRTRLLLVARTPPWGANPDLRRLCAGRGRMFWFTRKRLPGRICRLMAASGFSVKCSQGRLAIPRLHPS